MRLEQVLLGSDRFGLALLRRFFGGAARHCITVAVLLYSSKVMER